MGGISIAGGGEVVTTGDERDKGDGVGKEKPLGSRVCSGSQSLACSVGKRRQVVHPGVATLDGRVVGDKGLEDRVAVDVNKGELMIFDERVCEWEEGTEGRRWRGGISYSPPGQTLHVSTPAWPSRSLLWLSTLSIGSGICMLMENHGGTRSS